MLNLSLNLAAILAFIISIVLFVYIYKEQFEKEEKEGDDLNEIDDWFQEMEDYEQKNYPQSLIEIDEAIAYYRKLIDS